MFNKFKEIFNKKIHVSFINSENEEIFAESNMMPEQLPESFEVRTTMNLCDENWEIIEAIPMTSNEFIKTKELKLVLRKVSTEIVDPNDVLFSLPTISNELPSIQNNSNKLDKKVFEIYEDDWRQIDILSKSKLDLIQENLKSIRDVYENNTIQLGDGVAFKELHVRIGLDSPFDNKKIEKQILLNDLSIKSVYEGISFYSIEELIEGGFAVDIGDSLILYGQEQNNYINCLSLYYRDKNEFEKKIDNIIKLLMKYELCLVDWCSLRLYEEV